MSAAAASSDLIRPVLPFVREVPVHRAEVIGCRAGTLGEAPHLPGSAPARLLLLGDEPPVLAEQLRRSFPAPGYRVQVAGFGPCGLERVGDSAPDVVVLGLGARGPAGLEVYRQIRQRDARVPVICVARARRADLAIEAVKQGAYDFLFEPVEQPQLRRVVGEALAVARRLRDQKVTSESEANPEAEGGLVGCCPAMQEVYKAIGRIADQTFPVLITGESGTGKELVARTIYQHGARATAPFLAINCAAIPEALLESELFGHEKGAFTGADRRRIGKFEQASGGTLLLDEIGDMPLLAQAKVLRVLQEQSFDRVGGAETIRTDVRLIAATHRDLRAWSDEGKFRPDLYYRLGVFTIHLPPLRERGDDLPLLVQFYLRRVSRELGREVRTVEPEALERLRAYSWPGNLRELQSVLKQAVLRSHGMVLLAASLPPLAAEPGERALEAGVTEGDTSLKAFLRLCLAGEDGDQYAQAHRRLDHFFLPRMLEATGGNQQEAARRLGVARQTLRNRLRELGLCLTRRAEVDKGDPS